MSTWKDVGSWLQRNAGSGAALVGSLLTGNIPGAVAAGVAMVGSATGHSLPDQALAVLQNDPQTIVRLRELAVENDAGIRQHIRAMVEIEARDAQAEHEQTQITIRNGDTAEDIVVRRTRPLQSWASLAAAFAYVAWREGLGKEISVEVLMILLTLPWAYAGLRQWGKNAALQARLPQRPLG